MVWVYDKITRMVRINFQFKSIAKRNISYLYLSIILFGIGIPIGYFVPDPEMQINNLHMFDSRVPTTFDFIRNNSLVVFFLLSGSFSLGMITLINLIFNGILIGSVFGDVELVSGLILILPHAIFELPALWIAGAAGFKIPHELTRYLRGKKDYILNKRELKDFVYLALISFILIVIAAWIEANVTMKIAEGIE